MKQHHPTGEMGRPEPPKGREARQLHPTEERGIALPPESEAKESSTTQTEEEKGPSLN